MTWLLDQFSRCLCGQWHALKPWLQKLVRNYRIDSLHVGVVLVDRSRSRYAKRFSNLPSEGDVIRTYIGKVWPGKHDLDVPRVVEDLDATFGRRTSPQATCN